MTFPESSFSEAMLFGRYISRKEVVFAHPGTGSAGTYDIFTVTGAVHVVIVGYCTETLVKDDGTTISLGTDDVVAALIGATAADAITEGLIWFDDGPSECESQASIGGAWVSDNIAYTIAVSNITDGTIQFCCFWTPVTEGATVVPV